MQLEAAVEIQKAYSKLTSGQVPFTKKNMCAILVPLRDKYGLTDRQVLAVARNELSLEEIMLLSQTQEETKRHGSGEDLKRNAPAADVVPVVHGRWIRPHWKNSNYCCDCSECSGEAMHRDYQWDKNGIYPICPNCGARMDGDKNG